MHSVIELLNHYGYIVLLVALMLELIAFPLPGEVLMTYCGFLVNQQKLNWLLSIIIASSGTIIGITIAYFAGSMLGVRFFKQYGRYIHLGPDKLDKTSAWFNQYGNKLLLISYFIPGVRHITGYFSGITKISFKKFVLHAYIGAFLWTTTFISLGKVLGNNWGKYHSIITKYLIIGGLIVTTIIIIVYLYRNFKEQIINFIIKTLESSVQIFHTFGKIKVIIAGVALVFLTLSGIVIGLIQDYLANEFSQYDNLASLLIKSIFTKKWSGAMSLFAQLTSYKVIVLLTVLLFVWIIRMSTDKFLEIRFVLITIVGGEVLQFILRNIFKRTGPSQVILTGAIQYTFPSEHSLIAIVVYGFISFMIMRYAKKMWIGTASVVVAITICLIAGVSPLFFQIEYASDVFSGYIFGGLWLSLNIILLEVYRILPTVAQKV